MTDFHGLMIENYLLEKQIGAGGLAQVYLGRDYGTNHTAAIKIADPDRAQNAGFRALFLQEAQMNQRLHHPAILPITGAGEILLNHLTSPLPYLITDYVSDENMAVYRLRLARQQQMISLSSAIKCIILVAETLDYAHQNKVLHLDIKPENLLLRRGGNLASVVIADFGAAALLTEGQDRQQVMGTPAYMSPEQLAGQPVDGRSDLFALGVVLYELVTGQRPFPGETAVEIYHQQNEPLSPNQVPPGLRPIMQQALAISPAERFPTAAAFANALRQWQFTYAPTPEVGVIPQPGAEAVTRLQAEQWLPPVTQVPAIDYRQRWLGGDYRIFIAHQNGRVDLKTIPQSMRVIEISRLPETNGDGSQSGIGAICLPDPHISAQHATLERAGSGWQIVDNNSANGTYLEGERLGPGQPVYWRGRTRLRIGPYLLIWESHDKFGLTPEQADLAYRQDEAEWKRLTGSTGFWLTPKPEQTLSMSVQPADSIHMAPGETAELTITLLSQSAIVERVEVKLEGIPPTWYTLPQIDDAPLAGIELPILILIHPPQNEALAGVRVFDLTIFSPLHGQEYCRRSIELAIAPVSGQVIDVYPKNLRGAGQAQLTLWNTGNEPASFLVVARDPAAAMQFTPSLERVSVPPGEQRHHPISIKPVERRPILPPARQLPYELRVGRSETDLQTVNGQVELKPLFPGWLLIAIALLALLLYFTVPALAGRQAAKKDGQQQAAILQAEASATIASARQTIVISQELLAGQTTIEGTPNPEIQAVQENLAAAEADLAGANAANAQAEAAAATAAAMGPIGPAIPPARPPTAVTLNKNSIAEDAPPGTVIGLLTSQDPDENDSHTYTLVSGEGDSDNGLFTIEGSQLKLLGGPDFETQPELSLRVQSRDSRGQLFAQRLTVVVMDANEPFTAVTLSSSTVAENALSAVIGDLIVTDDPDQNDTHTFTLVNDPTGLLEISDSSLRVQTGQSLNYEAWPGGVIPLEISAADGGNLQISQAITITVTDENDLPTVSDFGKPELEDNPIIFTADDFTNNFADEDAGDTLQMVKITLLPAAGLLKVGEAFVYEGQELTLGQLPTLSFVPDRNFNGRLSFRWTGSDDEGYASQEATVTLTLIPVPDPATFVPDTSQIAVEEDASQRNFNWAVDIRFPDGDARDLRFVVCSNSNPDLFNTGPHVSNGGNLIFTPAPDHYGTAELQILLTDQPPPADGDETAVCANPTVPLTLIVEPVNDAPQINGNISARYVPTSTVDIFTGVTIQDADEPYTDTFNFAGGYLDISLSNEMTETLSVNTGAGIAISGGNVTYHDNPVGVLQGNLPQTAHLRVTNLTSFATIEAIEVLLKQVFLNTMPEIRTVFVTLSLNDGGNIDRRQRPQTATFVVEVK